MNICLLRRDEIHLSKAAVLLTCLNLREFTGIYWKTYKLPFYLF